MSTSLLSTTLIVLIVISCCCTIVNGSSFSEENLLKTLSSSPSSTPSTTTSSITNDQLKEGIIYFEKAYKKCISECNQQLDSCKKGCDLLKPRNDNQFNNFQKFLTQIKQIQRLDPSSVFLQDLKKATIGKRK